MTPRNRRADALGILGLARRAGAVIMGSEAVRQSVRGGHADLVLVAEDAAAGQAAKVERLLAHSDVPWRKFGTRVELGAALGGPPYSAVALTRAGFADRLLEELDAEVDSREGSARAWEDDQTYAG